MNPGEDFEAQLKKVRTPPAPEALLKTLVNELYGVEARKGENSRFSQLPPFLPLLTTAAAILIFIKAFGNVADERTPDLTTAKFYDENQSNFSQLYYCSFENGKGKLCLFGDEKSETVVEPGSKVFGYSVTDLRQTFIAFETEDGEPIVLMMQNSK